MNPIPFQQIQAAISSHSSPTLELVVSSLKAQHIPITPQVLTYVRFSLKAAPYSIPLAPVAPTAPSANPSIQRLYISLGQNLSNPEQAQINLNLLQKALSLQAELDAFYLTPSTPLLSTKRKYTRRTKVVKRSHQQPAQLKFHQILIRLIKEHGPTVSHAELAYHMHRHFPKRPKDKLTNQVSVTLSTDNRFKRVARAMYSLA